MESKRLSSQQSTHMESVGEGGATGSSVADEFR